ncbi:HAD family hydrolase [Virgibacillus litoralis]|uniref:Phosphoserine phosphatase n=1 Tax=Virgibacillus litoralis TaxID=578221 RepID=A0ABS4H992_9BACI|nr:HAD family hydrolase [Virgibacillus litoralis]MBP1947482.1 putative hydrolase of the HAD superfamily [Virgibacillus litoralis]
MIKALLFDLDDTLLWDKKSVKEAFKATCELAKQKYDTDPVKLEEKVRENARELYASYDTYAFTKMIGINPFEGLWGDFRDEGESFHKLKEIVPEYRKEAWTRGLHDLEVDDPDFGYQLAETFPAMRKKNAFVYEDSFEVLDQLKEEYQLLMLTNGSPELQQTKLDITPKLMTYFEHIVVSGAFGKGKPDPAIFEHALELLAVQKDEVLMVGDNLSTDILGAERAGIDSVWVNRHGKEPNDVIPTYEIGALKELLPLLKQ